MVDAGATAQSVCGEASIGKVVGGSLCKEMAHFVVFSVVVRVVAVFDGAEMAGVVGVIGVFSVAEYETYPPACVVVM